jgi:ubiquinone/menaquinone biosynthesis C-methylase UbiE
VSEKLEFTGERFTPECQREIWYEHLHRYAFASQWSHDARILDAACGEGYGSALLARTAGSVTGVDISADTIEHARNRYGGIENLQFQVADCTSLPFEEGEFDQVISFETLEHLAEQQELLAEFRRVLTGDGFLILSSPDKAVYSDRQGFENEYHVRELYRDELEELAGAVFPACRVFGQKLMFHSAIWSMDRIGRVVTQTSGEDGNISSSSIGHEPMYFIVMCAASEEFLPDLSEDLWLFDDAAESVYQHYHHEIRKNMTAGGIVAERDREIATLREQLAERGKPWWRRLLGGD